MLGKDKSDAGKSTQSMDISVVSPTQAAVEQAKSELKQ